MFKVECSKRIIETLEKRSGICSQLKVKKPERRKWRRSGVFIVHCEHISHLFLVFLLFLGIYLFGWIVANTCSILSQNHWTESCAACSHVLKPRQFGCSSVLIAIFEHGQHNIQVLNLANLFITLNKYSRAEPKF